MESPRQPGGASPETPFIFVSGTMGEEVAIDALKNGATDYVLKQRLSRLGPAVRRALADVEAKDARRASERHLQLVLDSIPECVKVLASDGTVQQMNRAGLRMVEADTPEQVLGRCVYPLIEEPDREAFRAINERSFQDERGGTLEFSMTGLKGTRRVLESKVVPLRDALGHVTGALSVTRDITERRRTERHHAFLVQLDDAVRPLTHAHEITQIAARLLGEHLDVDRCAYADVDDDKQTFDISGDFTRNVRSIVGCHTFAQFGREYARFMRADLPYVVEDAECDPRSVDVVAVYRQRNIRAIVAVPLQKAGRLVASMAVHQARPRHWRLDEVELVRQVANRCWESIERARIARALSESEARFRIAVAGSPFPLMLHAEDGEVLALSRSWTELTGYAPEELTNYKAWCRLAYPNGDQELEGQLAKRQASREVLRVGERVVCTKSAMERIWDFRAVSLGTLPDGRTLQMSAAADVTERKQAETALCEQLALTEAITNNASVALFIMDDRQCCVFMNPAAEQLTGYTLDEVCGRALHDFVHHTRPDGSNYPLADCPIERAFAKNSQMRGEEVFVHKGGQFYPVAYTASPIREGAGIAGTIIEVQDISERKRAEEGLRARNRRLALLSSTASRLLGSRCPQEFLRELFPELADQLGLEVYFNYCATGDGKLRLDSFTGVAAEVAQSIEWLQLGEAACGTVAEQRRAFSVEELQNSEGPLTAFVRSLGIRAYASFPLLAGSRFLGTLSFGTRQRTRFTNDELGLLQTIADQVAAALDRAHLLTELQQNNRELVRANEELTKANRELEEFAYVASHDLQEPLRMVNIYTEMLLRNLAGKLHEDTKEFAALVKEGAERMEQLIKDLLQFSRTIHADKPNDTIRTRAKLDSVCGKALSMLRSRVEETSAEVSVDMLPTVCGDEAHLTQVFQNLLSNALKYRKMDEVPRIHVLAEQQGVDWIISVSDNGIGFAPRHAERIFGLFKRLHKNAYPGTGLGLAICKRILERHGGTIWAESQGEGHGATFRFRLPGAQE